MYKGYWLWLIPLDEHTVSIGVTAKNTDVSLNVRTSDDFVEFLRSHKCMQEILGSHFELQDYKAMKRLSRRANSRSQLIVGSSPACHRPF